MHTVVFHTIIILYPIIVKCDKDLMCFPLKVYTVECELALAQYAIRTTAPENLLACHLQFANASWNIIDGHEQLISQQTVSYVRHNLFNVAIRRSWHATDHSDEQTTQVNGSISKVNPAAHQFSRFLMTQILMTNDRRHNKLLVIAKE